MATQEERLLQVIDELCDGNKAEFARQMNEKPQTVNNWLKRGFGKAVALKIAEVFPKINISFITYGIGSMCNPERVEDAYEIMENPLPEISQKDVKTHRNPDKGGIPYYDVDFLGGFGEMENDQTVNPDCLMTMPQFGSATCVCNVSGDSMSPYIESGDMVVLKRVDDPSFLFHGDIYGIVTTNDLRTIKRVEAGNSPDSYTLVPYNKEYKEQQLPMRYIRLVYKVMGVIRKF